MTIEQALKEGKFIILMDGTQTIQTQDIELVKDFARNAPMQVSYAITDGVRILRCP